MNHNINVTGEVWQGRLFDATNNAKSEGDIHNANVGGGGGGGD